MVESFQISHSDFCFPSNEDSAHADCPAEEARSVTFKKPSPNTLLGISVTGGNSTGIFISEFEKDGLAAAQGSLRIGDRILKVFPAHSSVSTSVVYFFVHFLPLLLITLSIVQ